MKLQDRLPRYGYAILVVIAMIALAAWRFETVSRQAVERVLRHDVAWSGVNDRTQAAWFERDIFRYALTGEAGDEQRLRQSYAVLKSRLKTWQEGEEYRQFLEARPQDRARYEELVARVERLGELIERLDEPDLRPLIVETAGRVRLLMDRIGMAAYTDSVNATAQARDELAVRQSVWRVFIMLMTGMGLTLLGILLWQNRALKEANRSARENAGKFAFLAHHDALTGLPNRAGFAAAFEEALGRTERSERKIAVFAVDLDGFKGINDGLGHAAGDGLLVSVAGRLKRAVCSGGGDNIVARMGGDEFIALIHIDGDRAPLDWAGALRDALEPSHTVIGGTVNVGATLGIAVSGADGEDNRRLPHNADLALTQAKASGKGSAQLYDPQMQARASRRLLLETELAKALRDGAIRPHYQPQVDLATGAITGVEALARWHHPDHGWIPPDEFIPVAEASGQIIALGKAILETACREAAAFPDAFTVAVNLSVAQMVQQDLVETIATVLARTGFPARRLKLEVTESMVMQDAPRAVAVLNDLKRLGVGISLDDFGTGYSALSYLRQFEWDEIKIDCSFVRSISELRQSYAIVRAMTSLARELGIAIVAEGIETPLQQRQLRKAGCGFGQGFLFSPPVPAGSIRATSVAPPSGQIADGPAVKAADSAA